MHERSPQLSGGSYTRGGGGAEGGPDAVQWSSLQVISLLTLSTLLVIVLGVMRLENLQVGISG